MRTEALFYIFAYPLKVWLNMKELGSHMFLHSVCCNIWLKYMKKVQSQRHVVRRGRSVLLTFSDRSIEGLNLSVVQFNNVSLWIALSKFSSCPP